MIIFTMQIYIKQLDLFFVLLNIDINKLLKINQFGEMAEWLNAAVLKTVKDVSPSGVRIPVSPHIFF